MKNTALAKWGATHALGVLIYVFLLAIFFDQASDWFGQADQKIITPVAALMLFIFSALITGGLVLGKPLMLYFDVQILVRRNILTLTRIGLFIFMALIFAVLLIMK